MGHATTRRNVRGAQAGAKAGARKAGREVRAAAANPWLERFARFGYVVRGVLYGTIGILAMGVALGNARESTDQRGTLHILAGNRLGVPILVAIIVGVAPYSLWGFIRAIYDPLNRGKDPVGIVTRLGFAWSGLNYAALCIFALGFLSGTSRGSGADSMRQMVTRMLSAPAGGTVTVVAGLIGIAGGLGQFVDAYRAGFRKDLKRNTMKRGERFAADWLGRFGMFSRGVIFSLLGYFVVQAGLHHDPARAQGMGAAFADLAAQPFGHFILAVVALGFIALALHSFANARWVRMMPADDRRRS